MGLLPASVAADVVGALGVEGAWWTIGFWTLAGGLAVGALAALAGLADFVALERDHPATRPSLYHLAATGTALVLFLGSLLVREGPRTPAGSREAWVLLLSGAGLVALLIGGWLGGQLVYRHGVGQRPIEPPPTRERPAPEA